MLYLLTLTLIILNSVYCDDESTLELVQVIFRHGNRTTDAWEIYPNDPHKDVKYYPYGLGQLTKKGKKLTYNLGKQLRKRYGTFLGPVYTSGIMKGFSSSPDRSKNSMQLVLTGLFPPPIEESVVPHWAPIPYFSFLASENAMFQAQVACPKFSKYLNNSLASPAIRHDFETVGKIAKLVSVNTGLPMNSFLDLKPVALCLATEDEWGLELPNWTHMVYPEFLTTAVLKSYRLLISTLPLKKLTVGYLLKKVLEECRRKISSEGPKIVLYSGHETNIAMVLMALRTNWTEEIPPYNSHVLIELHKINGTHEVKMFYKGTKGLQPLKMNACREPCRFEQFTELTLECLPMHDSCGNPKVDFKSSSSQWNFQFILYILPLGLVYCFI